MKVFEIDARTARELTVLKITHLHQLAGLQQVMAEAEAHNRRTGEHTVVRNGNVTLARYTNPKQELSTAFQGIFGEPL